VLPYEDEDLAAASAASKPVRYEKYAIAVKVFYGSALLIQSYSAFSYLQ